MNITIVVWCLLCLIWGSTWVFIKVGLRDLPPITFAGLRFLIAGVLVWLLVWRQRRSVPRGGRDWALIAFTGCLTFALNFGLIFWGEQRISSGLAAVLQAMIPAFGLVIAHYHLPAERITPLKLGGVLTGVAGVALIFADQMQVAGAAALWGCAALVTSALVVAYGSVLFKAYCRHLDFAALAAAQMSIAALVLLAVGALWEGNPLQLHWTATAGAAVLYLSVIGSAAAIPLYYWMANRIAVTKAMLISLVTPVVALVLGMVTLGERLTWRVAAGSAAILAGIGVIVLQRGPRDT